MKSPITFLHDEDHNDVEPVIAIRLAQANAIEHALRAIRTLGQCQAHAALSMLLFELSGDGPLSSRTAQSKLEP